MNHNKKRNVGIIYELLVRAVSAFLVENNKQRAQLALDVLSKFYNKDTELFKEFRLINALVKSEVSDTAVAAAILTESKAAARRLSKQKLDSEKSALIYEINHNITDQNFYYRNVPDYRTYATIQTLVNEWAQGDKSNLTEMVLLETKIVEWLTSPRQIVEEVTIDPNVDTLVVKIMNEKFNDKYADKLSTDQKKLINEYVFSLQNDGGSSITSRAIGIQDNAIQQIQEILKTEKDKIILDKAKIVESKILDLDLTAIDDAKLSKLMTLTQLVKEMKEA
jgi:hypothetical protein